MVATIFVSACVALWQAIERLVNPQPIDHLLALALAGLIGFLGNELAAYIRLRAGKRLNSPALVADGYHARTDGLVSLSVVASAALVALGAQIADPIIGLIITLVILRITWQSLQTVKADPGDPERPDDHSRDDSGHGHDRPGHGHEYAGNGHEHAGNGHSHSHGEGMTTPSSVARDR